MFEKFFTDGSFDFETRTLLGGIHYGAGDIGEMLTAVASITDGDAPSWVTQWRMLAGRIETTGDACLKAGHPVSARQAYLRAAVYLLRRRLCVRGWDRVPRRAADRVVRRAPPVL
jgi:hypothetical protein